MYLHNWSSILYRWHLKFMDSKIYLALVVLDYFKHVS